MNNKRRKEIQIVIEKIETINNLVQDILDEEQDAFDNMPENLQASERGEVSEAARRVRDRGRIRGALRAARPQPRREKSVCRIDKEAIS